MINLLFLMSTIDGTSILYWLGVLWDLPLLLIIIDNYSSVIVNIHKIEHWIKH